MPKIAVLDMAGKEVGTAELPESIFGIEPNMSVMHDVVVNHLANMRQGTQRIHLRSVVVSYLHRNRAATNTFLIKRLDVWH